MFGPTKMQSDHSYTQFADAVVVAEVVNLFNRWSQENRTKDSLQSVSQYIELGVEENNALQLLLDRCIERKHAETDESVISESRLSTLRSVFVSLVTLVGCLHAYLRGKGTEIVDEFDSHLAENCINDDLRAVKEYIEFEREENELLARLLDQETEAQEGCDNTLLVSSEDLNLLQSALRKILILAGCLSHFIQTVTSRTAPISVQPSNGIYWYLEVLKKYAVFRGRARRKEYWIFVAINLAIYNLLGILGVIQTIYCWAVLLPSIAVTVRRLHDTGRGGGWVLVGFIPLINLIVLLPYLLEASQPGDNRFGPNPKRSLAFESRYLKGGLIYRYKGTKKLENVNITFTVRTEDRKIKIKRFWAYWLPNEEKTVSDDAICCEPEKHWLSCNARIGSRKVRIEDHFSKMAPSR
jgi:uncharacterized membrane protein YhaH (DUF805 family)